MVSRMVTETNDLTLRLLTAARKRSSPSGCEEEEDSEPPVDRERSNQVAPSRKHGQFDREEIITRPLTALVLAGSLAIATAATPTPAHAIHRARRAEASCGLRSQVGATRRNGEAAPPARRLHSKWERRIRSSAARTLLRPSRRVSCPFRAGCRTGEDAAQAQHGDPCTLCAGGRDRDLALLAPARAGRGARDRFPVERSKRPPGDSPSERHQSLGRPESLEDQRLLWAALQDPALDAWHGQDENLQPGQQALWARSNGAASVGKYTDEMEEASPIVDDPPRRDRRDD
jgi:hypothetical protein